MPISSELEAQLKALEEGTAIHKAEQVLGKGAKAMGGVFGGLIDLVSRGQYASAKFVDVVASEGLRGLSRAQAAASQELMQPKERLSYTDLIRKHAPDFAVAHPYQTLAYGFVGDVALDPTTYLTFGAGTGPKLTVNGGTRVMTQNGMKVLSALVDSRKADVGILDATRTAFKTIGESIANLEAKGLTSELVVPKGLRVAAKVPFARAEVTLLSPKVSKAIGDTVSKIPGVTAIKEQLAALKDVEAIENVRGMFIRNADLPPEFVAARNERSAFLAETERKLVKSMWTTLRLPKASREKIGAAAAEMEEQATKYQRTIMPTSGFQVPADVTEQIKNAAIKKHQLGAKEVEALAHMHSNLNRLGALEKEVGLLTDTIVNYFPRKYAAIKNGGDFVAVRYGSGKLSKTLPAGKHRVFETLEEAKSAGYVPETDAVKLYALRVMSGARALVNKEFADITEDLVKRSHFAGNVKEVNAMTRDLRLIGESWSGASPEEAKTLRRAIDGMTRIFKTTATVAKPAFGVKQALSNTVQGYMVAGTRAFRAFDPRFTSRAADVLNHLDGDLLPTGIKSYAKLQAMVFKTDFGFSYTGVDIAKLIKDNHIARGLAAGGVSTGRSIEKQLRVIDRIENVNKVTGASKGFLDFATKAGAYWKFPAYVEDLSRTALLINGLSLGHSPEEAVKLVNKGLFDYLEGLARTEKQWFKNLVPFYTFNRFALPMMLDTVKTNPGRVANTKKGIEAFFGAWHKIQSDEDLNEAERYAIPGFILEQPSTFARFGPNRIAEFNAFNNFTPIDILNFADSPGEDKIDIGRTVQKTFLSTLAPALKVPIELALDKEFFSGRTISDARRLAGAGNVAHGLDQILPTAVKQAIGWEVGRNIRTGKEQVYINPYIAYAMRSQVPVLREVIRMTDPELTPTQKVLALLAGVTTYKVDLSEQRRYKQNAYQREKRDAQARMQDALKEGRTGSYEKERQELQDLIQRHMEEIKGLDLGSIRGAQGAP
jgi:hypothetical protein